MKCIVQDGRVVLMFSDAADLSAWPTVNDGGQISNVANVAHFTVISADIAPGTSVQELAFDGVKVIRQAPTVDYAAMRAEKLAQIGERCESCIELLVSTYPVNERLTFSKQQVECDAWLANNTAATPLIDAIVAQSGVAKAQVAANIHAKSTAFSAYCGGVIGYKHKLVAQVLAMADTDLPAFDPLVGWP